MKTIGIAGALTVGAGAWYVCGKVALMISDTIEDNFGYQTGPVSRRVIVALGPVSFGAGAVVLAPFVIVGAVKWVITGE